MENDTNTPGKWLCSEFSERIPRKRNPPLRPFQLGRHCPPIAGGPCSIRCRKSFSLNDHISSSHHVAPASASDFTWDITDLGFFFGVRPPTTISNRFEEWRCFSTNSRMAFMSSGLAFWPGSPLYFYTTMPSHRRTRFIDFSFGQTPEKSWIAIPSGTNTPSQPAASAACAISHCAVGSPPGMTIPYRMRLI